MRFVDGNTYGNGTVPQIYTMTGTAANPLVRIIIHKNAVISTSEVKRAVHFIPVATI